MKNIKNFRGFINESAIDIPDPSTAGDTFAGVLSGNRNSKEEPKGSNTGPMVNKYLASVGLKPGLPWCAAFVYYVFDQLSARIGAKNPLPKTGGVMQLWEKSSSDLKINIDSAKSNPSLIKPGQIFIMKRGEGRLGHTGIVVKTNPDKREIITIEGNTNDQKSGEGDRVGVNRRKIDDIPLVGFIDYFKYDRTPEFDREISSAVDGNVTPLSPLSRGESIPSDRVVTGYDGDQTTTSDKKPASIMSNILSGIIHTATGKLVSPEELGSLADKLR